MDVVVPLPATFWLETALLALSVLTLWLVVSAMKRAQRRRKYHFWYRPPVATRGRESRR